MTGTESLRTESECAVVDSSSRVVPNRVIDLPSLAEHLQGWRAQVMPIQSTNTRSLDDRRRRRLAVNGDNSYLDDLDIADGQGVASELVASSAAAPWVPYFEWRIWTYGAIIALLLGAVSFSLAQPNLFRAELAPLTNHLLKGDAPVLAGTTQTLLWFLTGQFAILIAWYRAQCKLDFSGRYRVWPWAAGILMLFALCSATRAHVLLGRIVAQTNSIPWRAETVAWLLPACVICLPLCFLVDRDVRRGRSTLIPLRSAVLLGLISGAFELFAPELSHYSWLTASRLIVPLFGAASLLVAMWLHARVVAYICPDPPEAEEPRLLSQLSSGWIWMTAIIVGAVTYVASFRPRWPIARATETEVKPKRRTRKSAEAEDEETPKKKRKPVAAKRTTKPKAKPKVVEEELEEEELEELAESGDEYSEETEESQDSYEEETAETEEEWEEEEVAEEEEEEPEEVAPAPQAGRGGKGVPSASTSTTSNNQNNKKPHSAASAQQREEEPDYDTEEDSDSDDASYRIDEGMTPEQMRGLSKRQKRELRQKMKDQQRNQRR